MSLRLVRSDADVLVPDGSSLDAALARTTHLGVGAHQDDLEILALHGILECHARKDAGFTGVTCTDGGGSPRTGRYASCSDDDMKRIRLEEQRTAARIGGYAAMIQLGHPSRDIKNPAKHDLCDDLRAILDAARPGVVYTHNPADKHATHIAVLLALLDAIRSLPAERRPGKLYGCEVWRDLDWLPDERKAALDVSGHDHLCNALLGAHDSQIAGGKRYDLAAAGRRLANATYRDSHAVDKATAVINAIDLTPLVTDDRLNLHDFVDGLIGEFREAVLGPLRGTISTGKRPA